MDLNVIFLSVAEISQHSSISSTIRSQPFLTSEIDVEHLNICVPCLLAHDLSKHWWKDRWTSLCGLVCLRCDKFTVQKLEKLGSLSWVPRDVVHWAPIPLHPALYTVTLPQATHSLIWLFFFTCCSSFHWGFLCIRLQCGVSRKALMCLLWREMCLSMCLSVCLSVNVRLSHTHSHTQNLPVVYHVLEIFLFWSSGSRLAGPLLMLCSTCQPLS